MEDYSGGMLSIISGEKKPDKNKFEFMTCVEDDGENEIFQIDIKIDINLKENGFDTLSCIPVDIKTNLIEIGNYYYTRFIYENISNLSFFQRNKVLILLLVISILLLIIIIILIICYYKRRKKSSENIEKKVLNEKLTSI